MKAELSREGILVLEPESPLEEFALGAWWDALAARVDWKPCVDSKAGGIAVKTQPQAITYKDGL